MLRLLKRISVSVDTVLDGVQATEKVFKAPVGFYSIVLVCLIPLLLHHDTDSSNRWT